MKNVFNLLSFFNLLDWMFRHSLFIEFKINLYLKNTFNSSFLIKFVGITQPSTCENTISLQTQLLKLDRIIALILT